MMNVLVLTKRLFCELLREQIITGFIKVHLVNGNEDFKF